MSATTTEPLGPPEAPRRARRLSPRKRKRVSLTIQYAIFIAVIVILVFAINWKDIQEYFFDGDVA